MTQAICNCDSYNFPHRLGGGKCVGEFYCQHGIETPDHPDFDWEYACEQCATEEAYWAGGMYDTLTEKYL